MYPMPMVTAKINSTNLLTEIQRWKPGRKDKPTKINRNQPTETIEDPENNKEEGEDIIGHN